MSINDVRKYMRFGGDELVNAERHVNTAKDAYIGGEKAALDLSTALDNAIQALTGIQNSLRTARGSLSLGAMSASSAVRWYGQEHADLDAGGPAAEQTIGLAKAYERGIKEQHEHAKALSTAQDPELTASLSVLTELQNYAMMLHSMMGVAAHCKEFPLLEDTIQEQRKSSAEFYGRLGQ